MTLHRMVYTLFLAAVVFVGFPMLHDRAAAGPVRIAVFISADQAPYEEALSGFHEYLREKGLEADYDVYPLHGSTEKAVAAIKETKERTASLIFTLGSFATEQVSKTISDVPVIACMVLRRELLEEFGNATGVALEFPVRIQLERLHTILPEATAIGVVYNPLENEGRIRSAMAAARDMGLRLEAYPVESPSELPTGLKAVSNRAVVLWGLADRVVLAPETARDILLFSMRNGIPLVGLSPAWVKAGALYSLDWDYGDMGRQCAGMVLRVLKGDPVGSIAPASPRRVLYCINRKTAERMKVDIPDLVVRGARKVY